jgi:hypothetical protein
MSDTTSFLGGAALAGLAAVILLKGGVTANSPMVGTPQYSQFQPLPTMPNSPNGYQSPMPNGVQTADYEKLKAEMDQMRSQMEQYRVQNEQLKAQSQSQQAFIDSINKNGMNPVTARQQPQQQSSGLFDTSNPAMSGLMWALGGMILTFGGGIALVGMFVLFARGQQRPSRTIEVFHDEYPTYIPARKRTTQVLPPRRVIKRVDAQDID